MSLYDLLGCPICKVGVAKVADRLHCGSCGRDYQIVKGVSVVGDYTAILSGQNTRDTVTGSGMSRDVFGAALRLSSGSGAYTLDIGYTNGTGSTTAFGLTPGLGGSSAVYAALTVRR